MRNWGYYEMRCANSPSYSFVAHTSCHIIKGGHEGLYPVRFNSCFLHPLRENIGKTKMEDEISAVVRVFAWTT